MNEKADVTFFKSCFVSTFWTKNIIDPWAEKDEDNGKSCLTYGKCEALTQSI